MPPIWHAADGRKYPRVREQNTCRTPADAREYIRDANAMVRIDFLLELVVAPAVSHDP